MGHQLPRVQGHCGAGDPRHHPSEWQMHYHSFSQYQEALLKQGSHVAAGKQAAMIARFTWCSRGKGTSVWEMFGEEGFAALEDEISKRFRRRRECLSEVIDDMPAAHDRQALGLRGGYQVMLELESYGVQ